MRENRLTAKLLRRIAAARASGVPLKELAREYGLPYRELSRELGKITKREQGD